LAVAQFKAHDVAAIERRENNVLATAESAHETLGLLGFSNRVFHSLRHCLFVPSVDFYLTCKTYYAHVITLSRKLLRARN
jgi:hypothetical protein